MHRDGEELVFNTQEQQEFDVPARLSALEALATARVFREVSDRLGNASNHLNPEAPLDRNILSRLTGRRERMGHFAIEIQNNCTVEEILQSMDSQE